MQRLKKLFGGVDLTWKKVILFSIAAGVYTAVTAIVPQLKNTSLHTIAESFEVWILFGILLIMNAKSNKDAALKCFVFFLISQPLVYLLQVPFNWQGWGLFGYYKIWFIWTVLCLPMGYVGYYIKKDKWWGYLILLPMIGLTALSYHQYLTDFTFCHPFYIAISVFCAAMMLLYPNVLFKDRRIRITGTVISALVIVGLTVWVALNPYRYSTEILGKVEGEEITEEYRVSVQDEKIGDVFVLRMESGDFCMIHGDFKKQGRTELTVTMPDGRTVRYDLIVRMNGYEVTRK